MTEASDQPQPTERAVARWGTESLWATNLGLYTTQGATWLRLDRARISWSRLALLQRGFLDLRLGYDFFAGPTRRSVVPGRARPGSRVHGVQIVRADRCLPSHGPA